RLLQSPPTTRQPQPPTATTATGRAPEEQPCWVLHLALVLQGGVERVRRRLADDAVRGQLARLLEGDHRVLRAAPEVAVGLARLVAEAGQRLLQRLHLGAGVALLERAGVGQLDGDRRQGRRRRRGRGRLRRRRDRRRRHRLRGRDRRRLLLAAAR